MPIVNRLLGALRGAADPARGGRTRPAPGRAPVAPARPRGGGLGGIVGSLLGGRRRPRI